MGTSTGRLELLRDPEQPVVHVSALSAVPREYYFYVQFIVTLKGIIFYDRCDFGMSEVKKSHELVEVHGHFERPAGSRMPVTSRRWVDLVAAFRYARAKTPGSYPGLSPSKRAL